MGMPKLGMSERVLTAFIDMYATNFHLKKITWRLDHRLANTLARLVTRNNSIHRRIDQGKTFDDLLPDALRGTGVVVKGVASTAGTLAALTAVLARDEWFVPARRALLQSVGCMTTKS